MRVIAKPALIEFWTEHPDAETPLLNWYTHIRKQSFANFNELRQTFSSADLADNFTIFDIGGNK